MKIEYEIEIQKNPQEIFPWIAEPEKALLWQKGVKSGEIIKETPERIGTTFKETMEENGNSLEMTGVIIGFVQNQSISFHLESKIHSVDVSYSLQGSRGKSTIVMRSAIHWKFPLNFIVLVLGFRMKNKILKQTKSEFAELKRLCEYRNS